MTGTAACILLVEDDTDIRETLAYLLRDEGYAVNCAENGKVAFERLDEMTHPCLILLDLFMPVMDGAQFVEHLRESGDSATPVVVISAAPPEGELARRVKALGVTFMRKPLALETVLELVQRYCPHRAA